MKSDNDIYQERILFLLIGGLIVASAYNLYISLNLLERVLFIGLFLIFSFIGGVWAWDNFSKPGRERKKRVETIKGLPKSLIVPSGDSVLLGYDADLKIPIYLPDSIRSRHVHAIGATGSGKTVSVILNLLRQDVERGLGAIILDAKGDYSFIESLNKWVPKEKLKIFDLCSEESLTYDPLAAGTPLESAQRLFSSLTWSEEYYASKARSVLQIIFQKHFELKKRNPTLFELYEYIETPKSYTATAVTPTYPQKMAEQDFMDISGLRDQVNSLCTGHLKKILSSRNLEQMNFQDVGQGCVLYFRLQSLMSPQIVATVGKLVINHLNYIAGTAHRKNTTQVPEENNAEEPKEKETEVPGLSEAKVPRAANKANLISIYLDEFATFACPEFADLISKARSANLALHFSHQSIGDLTEISKGFINRITDNSATKIVMRINDPDSADFFARSFGTKLFQKVTQRITKAKEIEGAEITGEGSSREAHQFRASPDLFKTLPTGVGSVLVAHGEDCTGGASAVFKLRFSSTSI